MKPVASVGARELKARLGTHLRRVREGGTLIVTERGRPVAELKPISSGTDRGGRRLEEMAARGLISRRVSGGPYRRFRPIRLKGGVTLSDAIIGDRADRF